LHAQLGLIGEFSHPSLLCQPRNKPGASFLPEAG
jgi:hypothetical protein